MVELHGAKVILREKRIEDAEKDYRWRSDPEIARLDAAYPLSMSYERYLKLFQDQLRYPTPGSHHFGTDAVDGTYIGNCMYYDLDSVRLEAELGIVIGDRDYWGNSYGYDAVTTLLDYMFTEINLNRVYLHTLDWNERARRSFAKSGFKAGAHGAPNVAGFHPDGSAARGLVSYRRRTSCRSLQRNGRYRKRERADYGTDCNTRSPRRGVPAQETLHLPSVRTGLVWDGIIVIPPVNS